MITTEAQKTRCVDTQQIVLEDMAAGHPPMIVLHTPYGAALIPQENLNIFTHIMVAKDGLALRVMQHMRIQFVASKNYKIFMLFLCFDVFEGFVPRFFMGLKHQNNSPV